MAREVALMMMGRASSSASSSSSSSCRVSWRLTAMASAAKEVSSLALLFLQGRHGLRRGVGAWREVGIKYPGAPPHMLAMPDWSHTETSNPKWQGCPDTEWWQSPQNAEGTDSSAEEWSQDSRGWNPHTHLCRMMGVGRVLSGAHCNKMQPVRARVVQTDIPHPGFWEQRAGRGHQHSPPAPRGAPGPGLR